MESPRRTTLKDIARTSDMSVAAVSMILRGAPNFAQQTIDRVKDAAERLNYKPDPALSALSAYRTRLKVSQNHSVLALLNNWSTRDGWSHFPSAQRTIAGATERANRLGYELQQFWADPRRAKPRRYADILLARGIRGVILAPLSQPKERFDFPWAEFAVVTLERPEEYPLLHHVVANYHGDIFLIWHHLLAAGYRRPGLAIGAEYAARSASQWESGHLLHQVRHLRPRDRVPTLVLSDDSSNEVVLRQWLRKYQPDVVISRDAGVLEAASAEGIAVPQAMGYISLNVLDDRPGVSGVLQNRHTVGSLAVDVINSLLLRNHRGFNEVPQSTEVDSSWHTGNTLPPRRSVREVVRSSSPKTKRRTGK